MSKVTVRLFEDKGIPANIPRPLTIRTQEDKKVWVPQLYKQGWKNPSTHRQVELSKLKHMVEVGVVITDNNLLIVDFDTDKAYEGAIQLNSMLAEEMRCQYIVHSSRKGGHFYYTNKDYPNIEISPLHSDKSVTSLDILTGDGHNAFAPTKGDASKTPLDSNTDVLVDIPVPMIYYINSIILSEASSKSKTIHLVSKEGYSDDNHQMVEQYILGHLSPQAFYAFYNLPEEMPPGESWKTLQALAFRLLKDETLTHEFVLQTLGKYDPEQRQSHSDLAPYDQNVYTPEKKEFSLTVANRHTRALISAYFDKSTGDYIVSEMQDNGQPKVHVINSEAKMKVMLETISGRKRSQLKMNLIEAISSEYTYLRKGGLDLRSKVYNKAFSNKYLIAFKGTKPDGYQSPKELIKLTQYMWKDEHDYLLASTQYRLRTFEHSAVITHIMGTEGSGKNLTVMLLTLAFTEDSQELDYTLFMDKHANHHVQPNTILGEVGDWNKAEQKGALSKIKTQSGNQGKATVRGMQKEAIVVDTINKIWVLGNTWMRLHTDPITQRRVHAVYMPQSLKVEAGGAYTDHQLEEIIREEVLVNFYYWLGNEFQPEATFGKTEYASAICRQASESYQTYIDSVEGDSDVIIRLLNERTFTKLLKALTIANSDIKDIVYKYNKQGLLVVSLTSLKIVFGRVSGADGIHKALDTIASNYEGNKLLLFTQSPEKYLTIYDAPMNLIKDEAKTEEMQIKAKDSQ